MGRRKLPIRRLQSARERQAKYSQRKQGIVRKARDLAILCDTDIMLLMFSPTDKSSLTVGQNRPLLAVLERLGTFSVDYREERVAYSLELLAKMHRRLNSDVDQKNFSLDSNEVLQLKRSELEQLRSRLAEKSKAIRGWKFPSTVNDLGELQKMEDSLSELIGKVSAKKGASRARGALAYEMFNEDLQAANNKFKSYEASPGGAKSALSFALIIFMDILCVTYLMLSRTIWCLDFMCDDHDG